MGNLTALSVKASKKPGRYQDGDGLILIVKPSGSRSWVLRMQVNGKRRDFGLGSAGSVSLAEAREKAAETRKLYKSGIDPVRAKRLAQAEQSRLPTFSEAAKIVYDEHQGSWSNKKHKAQWISTLENYANPFIGDVPVNEIDSPAIRDLLIPIWLAIPETARRVRQRVGTVLDWAHAKGYRDAEAPMRSVGRGLPRQPKRDNHFKAMPYVDVPKFFSKLGKTESVGRLALKFLILTAARSGEVRGAVWEEIDLKNALWTIPANRMKAGRAHIVPLTKPALTILKKVRKIKSGKSGAPVFPGISMSKPMSDMTLTKILRDMKIQDTTVHGFRSSFRDWAAEKTGYAGDVVEAALAHTVRNRVEAAYRRTNYLEKRKALMADWANFISEHNYDGKK